MDFFFAASLRGAKSLVGPKKKCNTLLSQGCLEDREVYGYYSDAAYKPGTAR